MKESNMEVVDVVGEYVSSNWETGDYHMGPALQVTQQHQAGCQG